MRQRYILLYYIISIQCTNGKMQNKKNGGILFRVLRFRVPPVLAFSRNFLSHGLSRCPLLLPSILLTLFFSHVPLSSAASDPFHS